MFEMASPTPASVAVTKISSTIIKPLKTFQHDPQTRLQFLGLNAWALSHLSLSYGQGGFLIRFKSKTNGPERPAIIHSLQNSLSRALFHFYPIAGRLQVSSTSASSIHISVHCNDAGALFIHAIAPNTTVVDRLSAMDPAEPFFPFNDAVNLDGCSLPLFAVQATELTDGLFLACSTNHCIFDGFSAFHLISYWLEIVASDDANVPLSLPPVFDCWLPTGVHLPIQLPCSHPNEFVERLTPPRGLHNRFFEFTHNTMSQLRLAALHQLKGQEISTKVSLFQALMAHVWRCVTFARRLKEKEETRLIVVINNRVRVEPPLPTGYFGCCIQAVMVQATARELCTKGLGWVARMVSETIAAHTDRVVRADHEAWVANPMMTHLDTRGHKDVVVGASPRLELGTRDLGWGEIVQHRMGPTFRVDGAVAALSKCGERDTVILDVSLEPKAMHALESNSNFLLPLDENRWSLNVKSVSNL